MPFDVLKELRRADEARQAARGIDPPVPRVLDQVDRLEIARSADARKARVIVKLLRTHSLAKLAREILPGIGDIPTRHKLEGALDRFMVANDVYMDLELRSGVIDWMGPARGLGVHIPPSAPEHKVELAAAWDALLMLVNQITNVGIHKPHREHPIFLLVDPEQNQ